MLFPNTMFHLGNSEIDQVAHGLEPDEFWLALANVTTRPLDTPIVEHVPANFAPDLPKLFEIRLGMGYLEVPQVIIVVKKFNNNANNINKIIIAMITIIIIILNYQW